MNNKICIIYNYAQHYRAGIFKLLDKELGCDFFFGNKMGDVKKLDYSLLENFKKELNNKKIFSSFYWQSGAIPLFFKKKYSKYILLGEYYCLSTWIIVLFIFFTKKKVFLWTHGCYGNEGFLKKNVKKIFFNLSDGILLYGNYARELMIKEGYNSSKLHVIYNSLDYNKQITVRNQLNKNRIFRNHFNNNYSNLIFIGRLTRVKKLDMLLFAQKKLFDSGFKCNVIFVGDGDQKKDLLALSRELGLLNNIWFYGSCFSEHTIGNLIFNADICVAPGNVGLTAMHSMVYGTPVITHGNFKNQMPEFEAIIQGKTGDFYVENQLESLILKIREWLDKNKNKREEIRDLCFSQIDNYFNPIFQINKIKEILNEK
jgi:glycosyltransferase involved in cell wall biosynthesis